MNITLTPELERFVSDKIRAGQFRSADELFESALNILRDQESLTPADIAELQREVAIGTEQLDRGDSATWDAETMKASLACSLVVNDLRT